MLIWTYKTLTLSIAGAGLLHGITNTEDCRGAPPPAAFVYRFHPVSLTLPPHFQHLSRLCRATATTRQRWLKPPPAPSRSDVAVTPERQQGLNLVLNFKHVQIVYPALVTD